jgi:uncharacterized protein (TIGR00290 family)
MYWRRVTACRDPPAVHTNWAKAYPPLGRSQGWDVGRKLARLMVMKEKVLLSWSGGKDAALALHELQDSEEYEISALLTTVTEEYDRISMHGVRRILLERQAKSLSLPLEIVLISKDTSDEEYGRKMQEVLEKHATTGVSAVAFGDIFLEDVRRYREDNLSKVGMEGVFPLWDRDSTELAHRFIELGFEAVITCVDSHFLDGAFVGRAFDAGFLFDLPPDVDPCGENGEFHTFVHDGPVFHRRIMHKKGEIALRDKRFYYCDLMPV